MLRAAVLVSSILPPSVSTTSYSYDANGNLKSSPGRTLVWNVENRLHSVAGESYLYDENGIRLKKTVGSTSVYYPFSHYEPVVSGSTTTITKYYFFGGQRIATRQGSTLKYLHSDHLGGTVLETSGGFALADMSYWAYGRQRDSGPVSTSRRFTGQVYDGSGLYYMNARYYDPALGMFVSPDTLIPNPGQVVDYNRFAYARLNPLKFNDPSGHTPRAPTFDQWGGGGGGSSILMYLLVRGLQVSQTQGPQIAQQATQIGAQTQEIYPAVADWMQSNPNAAQQGQQFDPGGNTAGPGGNPNDPFQNAANVIQRGVSTLRAQISNPNNYPWARYGAQAHLSRAEHYQRQGALQSVNPTGRGTIDLILNNNTGVEVKYWSESYLSANTRSLANQIQGFNNLNLNRITVEFVQTRNNPVTSTSLNTLRGELTRMGVDMSTINLTVVPNPGIP